MHAARRLKSWVLGIAGLVALLCLLLAIYLLLQRPSTILSADVKTERLVLTVTHPPVAVVLLERALIDDTCHKQVEISPAKDSSVIYTRRGSGPLIVDVRKVDAITASSEGGRKPIDKASLKLRIEPEKRCGLAVVRLPANGELRFGELFSSNARVEEPPSLLLSAKLTTYARAVQILGGWGYAGALYQAHEIEVPSGSVLGSIRREGSEEASRDARPPYWRGFVEVQMSPKEDATAAMSVHAVTESDQVGLYLPVPFREQGQIRPYENDRIFPTLMSRLASDPNLQWLLLLPLVILAIASAINTLLDLFEKFDDLDLASLMERQSSPGNLGETNDKSSQGRVAVPSDKRFEDKGAA